MPLNKDHRVKVIINEEDWGIWDKRAGGKTTSPSGTYIPGRVGFNRVPRSGPKEHEPVVCERGTDTGLPAGALKELRIMCGAKVPVRVHDVELDPEGNVMGDGEYFDGVLTDAWNSNTDSENDDEGMIAITMAVTYIDESPESEPPVTKSVRRTRRRLG